MRWTTNSQLVCGSHAEPQGSQLKLYYIPSPRPGTDVVVHTYRPEKWCVVSDCPIQAHGVFKNMPGGCACHSIRRNIGRSTNKMKKRNKKERAWRSAPSKYSSYVGRWGQRSHTPFPEHDGWKTGILPKPRHASEGRNGRPPRPPYSGVVNLLNSIYELENAWISGQDFMNSTWFARLNSCKFANFSVIEAWFFWVVCG